MDITKVLELSLLMLTVEPAWTVIEEPEATLTMPPLRLMLNVPPDAVAGGNQQVAGPVRFVL